MHNLGMIAAAMVLVGGAAQAATLTTFDDRALFDAATTTSTEDFESFIRDTSFLYTTLDIGPFTVTNNAAVDPDLDDYNFIDVPPQAFSTLPPDASTHLVGGLFDGDTIVLTFDSPITAFGADFRGFVPSSQFSQFEIAGQTLDSPRASGFPTLFFGVISDSPFSTVTVRGLGFPIGDSFGMDNVAYGSASPAAIPVPATLPLLALALAAIGGLATARRRG